MRTKPWHGIHLPKTYLLGNLMLLTNAGLATIAALLVLAGCGSDDKVTNPPDGGTAPTSSFNGTISGSGVSGALTLTVNTANPAPPLRAGRTISANVAASGTLAITGGGSVPLSGTYDDVAKTCSVTGGGWTLDGSFDGSALEGTFSGPAGESGVFTALAVGSGTDTVAIVIDTFTSNTGGPGGVWNTSIRGSGIHGNAWPTGSTDPIPLDGTFSATGGGAGDINVVNPANPTGPPLATGMLAANGDASGSYVTAGDNGDWLGRVHHPQPVSRCPVGIYELTSTSPAGGHRTVKRAYTLHSACPNEGAGPGCCDVVYDEVDAECNPVLAGVVGFDYYRDTVPGAGTCPPFFNSDFFMTGSNTVLHFVLTSFLWTSEFPFHVEEGTYQMFNSSNALLESGTFKFDITFVPEECGGENCR